MSSDLPALSDPTGRRAGPPAPVIRVAEVVRSDATGVWAAPVRGDRRAPLGPLSGAWRYAPTTTTGGAGDGAHAHGLRLERLPEGTRVTVASTADGPWVLSWEPRPEDLAQTAATAPAAQEAP